MTTLKTLSLYLSEISTVRFAHRSFPPKGYGHGLRRFRDFDAVFVLRPCTLCSLLPKGCGKGRRRLYCSIFTASRISGDRTDDFLDNTLDCWAIAHTPAASSNLLVRIVHPRNELGPPSGSPPPSLGEILAVIPSLLESSLA